MRKSGKVFLKELYAQQTDHRGALACVGSERFSGIRFVCLGFSVFLWCKESVHLPVVDAQEFVRACGHVERPMTVTRNHTRKMIDPFKILCYTMRVSGVEDLDKSAFSGEHR